MGLNSHETARFNDGEGLTHGDLNNIIVGATQRAWDIPGYADLIPQAAVHAAQNYDGVFDSGVDISTTVFCKGGGPGLFATGGFDLNVGAGIFGVFAANTPPTVLDTKMRWTTMSPGVALTFTAAPSGQKRYDVVTLGVVDGTGGSETRDFKDATTGALSSTSVSKRNQLVGTLGIFNGTAGVTPSVPNPSGLRVVALVLVNDTAIETVWDCTQPFGPAITAMSIPGRDFMQVDGWTEGAYGSISVSALSRTCVLFPPMLAGDPSAKVIGVELKTTLSTGFTAELVAHNYGYSTYTSLDTITSLITSGTEQTSKIDVRGYPSNVSAVRGPYWASGDRVKRGQLNSAGRSIGIRLTSNSAGGTVYWVKWYFAKG